MKEEILLQISFQLKFAAILIGDVQKCGAFLNETTA